jgi:hypothetical protein
MEYGCRRFGSFLFFFQTVYAEQGGHVRNMKSCCAVLCCALLCCQPAPAVMFPTGWATSGLEQYVMQGEDAKVDYQQDTVMAIIVLVRVIPPYFSLSFYQTSDSQRGSSLIMLDLTGSGNRDASHMENFQNIPRLGS